LPRLICFLLLMQSGFAVAEPCQRADPTGLAEWPQVELLSRGEEPRQALRVRLEEGDVQRRQLEMAVSMAQVGESGPVQAVPLPLLVFDIETRVGSVDQNLARVHYRYLSADAHPAPGVPSEVLEATRSAIQGMSGVSGSYVLSHCLYADDLRLSSPEGIDDRIDGQLRDLEAGLGLLSDPLPDEAVGLGARWKVSWHRVENALTQPGTGGVRLHQSTIYTIEAMDGHRITLRIELSQSAEPQEVEPPELRNLVVKLVHLESSGQGRMVLDLGAILPIEAHTELSTEQLITVDQGLGDEPQTQQIHVRSTLRKEPE
jgi:hypothetical protein